LSTTIIIFQVRIEFIPEYDFMMLFKLQLYFYTDSGIILHYVRDDFISFEKNTFTFFIFSDNQNMAGDIICRAAVFKSCYAENILYKQNSKKSY